MKSLKIVDKLLEKINQYDDWFLTEIEAEQIKQDLEILKIFNKFFGDAEIRLYEWDGKKRGEISFCGTDYYTYSEDENEALEMFELKEWLKENNNDN